jgi:cytidylate kinase
MTVIAMTREIGSLGADVAAGVAEELNLKIVYSEIVANQIAERMGIEESAVQRYVDGSASILERWMINRRKLSRYTSEEILRLAQEGNVLIRGWGAAALLHDMPQVISVRICAPMAFRVRTMMRKTGAKNPDAMRQEIERFDTAHTRVMRGSFDVEREDALLYHLVLNTDRLTVGACVDAVCRLARHSSFQDHETTQSALANRFLAAKVSSALGDNIGSSVAPTGVAVSADNGKVTLAGTSSNGHLRAMAEKVAARIAGVSAIDNRIVSVPSHGSRF